MDETGFLRKIGKIIGRKCVGGGGDSVVAAFFEEVARYERALAQSYANVLGKERAERLAKLDKSLLCADSYLSGSAQLEGFICGGFSSEENLLFYVGIELGKDHGPEIDPSGRVQADPEVLKTFPVFFLSPKIIRERSRKLKKSSLPAYLTLWLHEYSHFIGYCLQKRPLAAGLAILYAELVRRGQEGLSIYDIKEIMESDEKGPLSGVAETIMYLHWLDEDMANFLQELILKDLGFDPESYFGDSVKDRPFYRHFKKWGRERYVEYLEDWNNTHFEAPQFMKNFLNSLNAIGIERCPVPKGDIHL